VEQLQLERPEPLTEIRQSDAIGVVSGLKSPGIGNAPSHSAVTLTRSILAGVARVVFVALVAAQVVLSNAPSHATCAAAKHACGSTARIAACCCQADSEATRAAGIVVQSLRVVDTTVVALVPRHCDSPIEPAVRLASAPPTAVPADIPILLSNLRI
jgi:hypothetical protein